MSEVKKKDSSGSLPSTSDAADCFTCLHTQKAGVLSQSDNISTIPAEDILNVKVAPLKPSASSLSCKGSGSSLRTHSLQVYYVKQHKQQILRMASCQFQGSLAECEQLKENVNRKREGHTSPVRKLLALINPVSGSGKSLHVYQTAVAPILEACDVACDIVISTKIGDLRNTAQTHSFSDYNAMMVVGGDGSLNEVVWGLVNRAMEEAGRDIDDKFGQLMPVTMPFGVIPTGTGNYICQQIQGNADAITSVIHVIRGHKHPMNVVTVHGQDRLLHLAHLVLHMGFVGDIIHRCEMQRWMGNVRYHVASHMAILRRRLMAVDLTCETGEWGSDLSQSSSQNGQKPVAPQSSQKPVAPQCSCSQHDQRPVAPQCSCSQHGQKPVALQSSFQKPMAPQSSQQGQKPMAPQSSSSQQSQKPMAPQSSCSQYDQKPVAPQCSCSQHDHTPVAPQSPFPAGTPSGPDADYCESNTHVIPGVTPSSACHSAPHSSPQPDTPRQAPPPAGTQSCWNPNYLDSSTDLNPGVTPGTSGSSPPVISRPNPDVTGSSSSGVSQSMFCDEHIEGDVYNIFLPITQIVTPDGRLETQLGADSFSLVVLKNCSLAEFIKHFTRIRDNTGGMTDFSFVECRQVTSFKLEMTSEQTRMQTWYINSDGESVPVGFHPIYFKLHRHVFSMFGPAPSSSKQ